MGRKLTVAFLIFALSLVGCVRFENPLPIDEAFSIDPYLEGLWSSAEGKDFLHIAATKGRRQYDFLSVEHHAVDGFRVSHSRAFPSEINGVKFLNVQLIAKDENGDLVADKEFGYFIFRYSASAEQLNLSTLEPDKLEPFVINGKLKGKLKYSKCKSENKAELRKNKKLKKCGWLNEVIISESSPDLVKFFVSENGKDVFGETKSLKKVNVK